MTLLNITKCPILNQTSIEILPWFEIKVRKLREPSRLLMQREVTITVWHKRWPVWSFTFGWRIN